MGDYCAAVLNLTRFEETMWAEGQRSEALGTALLKMYLAPVIEENPAKENRMAEKIEPLNREGWPIVQAGFGRPRE